VTTDQTGAPRTLLLGAHGKLGGILARGARRAGAGWHMQARKLPADRVWDGTFSSAAQVFTDTDTIINMIGDTGTDHDKLERLNVGFVRQLLDMAARTGVGHVILASSAAVYGAGDGTPFTEELHRLADHIAPERSYIGPHDLFDVIHALCPTPKAFRILNIAHPQAVRLDALLTAYKTRIWPDLTWTDQTAPDGTPQSVTLSTRALSRHIPLPTYPDPADAFAAQVAQDRAS